MPNAPKPDYSDIRVYAKFVEKRVQDIIVALGEPPSNIKQTDHSITATDGLPLRLRVYQPTEPPRSGSPLIILYHGGGFCVGGLESEELLCRNLVRAFGAVSISAQYRLAPQHPFPAAIHSAWDSLKWAASNAKSLGADPSLGFIVGGTSAGGNIAAVLSHVARDEKLSPPLTGQYLCVPPVLSHDVVPEKYKPLYLSWEQNKDAVVLPRDAIDMFMGAYKPDTGSPIYNAFHQDHTGLPPAYFVVCGLDPLRDEGLIYEKVLRKEYGIKTKLDLYPGQVHGFWAFFPMLKTAGKFNKDVLVGIGWLLSREPQMDKINADSAPTLA